MCDANRSERGDREDRSDYSECNMTKSGSENSLDSECNLTKSNSENSLDSEYNITKSGSENSLDSECRVDRMDRVDKKKHTEDDICELKLKSRSIGLYNKKPINIIMKGRNYYLKYDGYLYNIPEWAKEINIKNDFTIYHAIGIIEWTVNNKGEGFRN